MLLSFLLSILGALPHAHATWSVTAVDPSSGAVGIAGATCGPFVWGIAGLAPGAGVVAAQYDTSTRRRDAAVAALLAGASAEEALAAALEGDEASVYRQYAVWDLDGGFAGHTGAEVEGVADIHAGEDGSAQGNTLRAGVVDAAFAALQGAEGPLEERLLAGLLAGAEAGGDTRCEAEDAAKSAFLYVAGPDDTRKEPQVEIRASGKGAPWEVAAALREGKMSCAVAPGETPGVGWMLGLGGLLLLGARRKRPGSLQSSRWMSSV